MHLPNSLVFISDGKRGLLPAPERPANSKSPLEFDAYTLNHAAFVGQQVVSWLLLKI